MGKMVFTVFAVDMAVVKKKKEHYNPQRRLNHKLKVSRPVRLNQSNFLRSELKTHAYLILSRFKC